MDRNTATPVKAVPASTAKLMTKDELNRKMQAHEAVQVVNVLDPKDHTLGSIKGSVKIPLDQLDARLTELDKTKDVVTYCAGVDCNASKRAAEKLAGHGFRATAYEGGIKEWKAAGLPIEA